MNFPWKTSPFVFIHIYIAKLSITFSLSSSFNLLEVPQKLLVLKLQFAHIATKSSFVIPTLVSNSLCFFLLMPCLKLQIRHHTLIQKAFPTSSCVSIMLIFHILSKKVFFEHASLRKISHKNKQLFFVLMTIELALKNLSFWIVF
jgi:hypothetical protein